MNNALPISIWFREYTFQIISKLFKLKESSAIFCYHSISDDGSSFSINKKNFALQIGELLKTKKIVGIDDLFKETGEDMENMISITFDDGYENIFNYAYPILKKHGIKACVFINKLSDINNKTEFFKGKRVMQLKQLQKLKKEGWDIGYHSKSHSDLRTFDEKELVDDIVRSKEELEKKLSLKIKYFSYPFGLFNKKTLDMVRNAGYKYAFTADGGGVNFHCSCFKIGRILLDKHIKINDLKVLTSKQGQFFNKIFTSFLRKKDNFFLLLKKGKKS